MESHVHCAFVRACCLHRECSAADCLLAVLVPDTDDRSVSGGTVANPDAMGMAEVAEFYCALLAGELPVAGTRGLARVGG